MTRSFNQLRVKKQRQLLGQNITTAEMIVWKSLRNRQLGGFKFRRQYSIDRYILDFYCPECKLGIEIDGDTHYTDKAKFHDLKRQNFIKTFGIRTLRFTNLEIYKNLEGVMWAILEELNKPHPNPLLGKERGNGKMNL